MKNHTMSTIIQRLFDQISNQFMNLKTDKDRDQLNINNLKKMIRSLRCGVYNKNTKIEFLNQIEINKQ